MKDIEAVSPIDGRYWLKTKELSGFFSEYALMKYRILVECKYLIEFMEVIGKPLTEEQKEKVRSIFSDFSADDAEKIKESEKTTRHDVKSGEYLIKEKLKEKELNQLVEQVHFALTSSDINNLAYGFMVSSAVEKVIKPKILELIEILKGFSESSRNAAMLGRTHGQPATPTTFGKEVAVYVNRLESTSNNLFNRKLKGKLGGAVGCLNAHKIAYPEIDWLSFSKKFVEEFGFEYNKVVTQIEPMDALAGLLHDLQIMNNVLIDLCRDFWHYISIKYLKQKPKEGYVGSSTMPHKVNPLDFENAEGNMELAVGFCNVLANKLQLSRLQRDLSNSTVMRNIGIPFAYSLIAYGSLKRGLGKIEVDEELMGKELSEHPEVLAEAIQTVLRREGVDMPYEKLKELTQNKKITLVDLRDFISGLEVDDDVKQRLLLLEPKDYVGYAKELVNYKKEL